MGGAVIVNNSINFPFSRLITLEKLAKFENNLLVINIPSVCATKGLSVWTCSTSRGHHGSIYYTAVIVKLL